MYMCVLYVHGKTLRYMCTCMLHAKICMQLVTHNGHFSVTQPKFKYMYMYMYGYNIGSVFGVMQSNCCIQ